MRKGIKDFEEKCLELYGNGYSIEQICRKLNVGHSVVWEAIHKHSNENEEEGFE